VIITWVFSSIFTKKNTFTVKCQDSNRAVAQAPSAIPSTAERERERERERKRERERERERGRDRQMSR
jgi:hypothetical protein